MKAAKAILAAACAICISASAEIKVTDLTKAEIPEQAQYKGDFVAAVTWKDKDGVHYVIESETPLLMTKEARAAMNDYRVVENTITGEKDSIANYELVENNGKIDTLRNLEADYRVKGLFTYHYVNSKKGWNLEWKNMDNVNQCSYKNLTANYLTKPIITDLDNDKKAEIWFVYVLGCRQYHLTPLGIREVVYVNGERATVRGLQITKNGDKTYGGESKADERFMGLPQVIKEYGKKLWLKHVNQE